MTDLAKENINEIEPAKEYREEREQDDDDDDDDDSLKQPNPNFLREMNLLITVLSLVTLSSEDCMDSRENEVRSIKKDNEAKASISRTSTRRRDIHDVKSLGRRAHWIQPIIKDCRHGRKM